METYCPNYCVCDDDGVDDDDSSVDADDDMDLGSNKESCHSHGTKASNKRRGRMEKSKVFTSKVLMREFKHEALDLINGGMEGQCTLG